MTISEPNPPARYRYYTVIKYADGTSQLIEIPEDSLDARPWNFPEYQGPTPKARRITLKQRLPTNWKD